MSNMQKFGVVTGLVFAAALVMFMTCVERIDYGSVGVRFNLMGDDRGVSQEPISAGYAIVNPFTQNIYEYPITTQNFVYGAEEKISFNSSDGAPLKAEVGLSFSVQPDKVVAIFKKFRKDINSILHTYIRTLVRDTLNEVASKYKATEIFGDKKQAFMVEFHKEVSQRLGLVGFSVDQCSLLGEIECNDNVKQSVNSVIAASQRAIEAENKIRQSEAEAKQKIAEAEGEAQAILAKAKAQAEANKLVNESLTPELVRYKFAEKWDGKAPQVMGHIDGLMVPITKE